MDIFLEIVEDNILLFKIVTFLISSVTLLFMTLLILKFVVKKVNEFIINRFSSINAKEMYRKAVLSNF